MVPVDHENLGIAVAGPGVVDEPGLVALADRVDRELGVQVEEVARDDFVVDDASAVGLVLGDHLAAVLDDELVLLGAVLEDDAPPGHRRLNQLQMLLLLALDADVSARAEARVALVGAAVGAQVGIALSARPEAGASRAATVSAAAVASAEPIRALRLAKAELLAEIHRTDAVAVGFAA